MIIPLLQVQDPTQLQRIRYQASFETVRPLSANFVLAMKRLSSFDYLLNDGYRGITAVSFGAMAGLFALFFFSDLPRVRKDIMQKVPFIGDHFVKDVPPSDNVSSVPDIVSGNILSVANVMP